ncbi:hypothetical protein FBALC1_01267 [Flavobacteriales bacterium ALC-1]|nr:hypothetical protein FBALC1_01267 [Flavobacteriales bacterium ALC-1]
MKLKLTIILLFVTLGIHAQKELQPYNFSLSDNGKTETIMIYASAESVNSITFTLKNEKNETLKTKKDNSEEIDITFKVFPFTENSFRSHLVDAINSIVEKDESNKEYAIFKTTLAPLKKLEEEDEKKDDDESKEKLASQLSKRKNAVQDVRNIFQFFDALAITAFQYDNEPVAGILKYNDLAVITKKTINGLDTDDYFNRQSKVIRKLIYNPEPKDKDYDLSDSNPITLKISRGKYQHIKLDDFIRFLAEKRDVSSERFFVNTEKTSDLYKTLTNNCQREKSNESNKKSTNIQLNIDIDVDVDVSDPTKKVTKSSKSIYQTLIVNENSYIWSLLEFYQNSKKSNNRKARSELKHHINKQLKIWYNNYEMSKFVKGNEKESFANMYFKFKNRKTASNRCIKKLSNEINSFNDLISQKNKKITFFKAKKDSIKRRVAENKIDINKLNDQKVKKTNNVLVHLENKEKEYKEGIELIDIEIKAAQIYINSLNSSISKMKLEKSYFNLDTKKHQNDINFLIAHYYEHIAKVPLWNFKINDIELDINNGFIEHITVTGEIIKPKIDKIAILNSIKTERKQYYQSVNIEEVISDFFEEPYVKEVLKELGKELKFENEFPIGFSSKTDFADFDNYDLYSFKGNEKIFSLPLTNVINLYVQRHQNDRLDFSPKNQVVRLPLHDIDKNKEVELKKEKSSKILNAKIFTDFNGLKESEPNGLVQFEVEKQIPLWTKRMELGAGRSSNFGFANYATFNLTWAKLNEEDRELQVLKAENFVNNESQIDNYITYLDLIRFENVSVGVDLNVASFDFPLIKTRVELNGGIHYGRVKVVDEITTTDDQGAESTSNIFEKDVNMIRMYPDVILRIRPEERFGGYLRFRPFKTIVPDNDEFYTIYSEDEFLDNPNDRPDALKDQRWLQRYELGAFYTPSADSDNKFFFRYRYTNTSEWETNGYSEIQLGYQIYLKF